MIETPTHGAASDLSQPGPALVAGTGVAIVIVTHNQARYLGEAIASAVNQTRPADEVVVIDDGSTDDPASVVRNFAGVRLVRQDNLMLAAARNTGTRETHSPYILYLDADDRLLPAAIEASLSCFRRAPDAGFVFGAYRLVDEAGTPISKTFVGHVEQDAYRSFLEGNRVNMHGTVLYRRDTIEAAGGFDTSLRRCEDYDLYLRIARHHAVACHAELTADYRRHGENMSLDYAGMLESVSRVMDRQRDIAATRPEWRSAWEGGTARWRDATCGMASAVALAALRKGQVGRAVKAGRFILETSPMAVPRGIARRLRKRARRSGSASLFRRVSRFFRGRPLGPIWLGSVGRTSPVDAHFGFGRGTPVDRHYINTFLASHREDIRGRVLEIGDSSYTTTFGTGVERSDVLHVHAGNPYATIVGDLSQPNVLPPDSFDCLVITQTLHCIYDIRSAVVHLRDALKPGGVALVTLPFISQVDRGEWGNTWYWGVAPAAAAAMFREVFGDRVEMEVFGNVYAATVFLQGLAFEEVSQRKLAVKDEAYPVLVAIRAERSHA